MSARAPWSLQRRLVAALLALLALTGIVVGAVSVATLHSMLISRVDDELDDALAVARQRVPGLVGPLTTPPSARDLLPGQAHGALAVVSIPGRPVQAQYLGDAGENQVVSVDRATLFSVEPGAGARTVDFGSPLGSYRLAAARDPSGVEIIVGLPLQDTQLTTLQLAVTIALVTAAALVVAAVVATVVVRLALRPLGRVTAIARSVSELPLARGQVALPDRVPEPDTDPRTEVGQVGGAFNRMLDHIAAALAERQETEDKIRRFVADASHELRTPLAAVRGYAELTRRAPYELPEDARHVLARIESESLRMTRLVEELLLLARLDEGRDVVTDDVDVAALVADAVADARAAGPDHEWAFTGPDEPVSVRGDAERLHQVVANLLANARTHTPEGTHVSTSIEAGVDDVAIVVEDDGPGIPESIQPTLFERFVRGDASRSRRAGSTGLGLAIVQAIVAAHGGSVGVESRPGRTRFTVRLPRRSPEASGGAESGSPVAA